MKAVVSLACAERELHARKRAESAAHLGCPLQEMQMPHSRGPTCNFVGFLSPPRRKHHSDVPAELLRGDPSWMGDDGRAYAAAGERKSGIRAGSPHKPSTPDTMGASPRSCDQSDGRQNRSTDIATMKILMPMFRLISTKIAISW